MIFLIYNILFLYYRYFIDICMLNICEFVIYLYKELCEFFDGLSLIFYGYRVVFCLVIDGIYVGI